MREWVAKALVNKGVSLGRQGKPDDEIACYDDVVARFGASDEAALREWVAKALVNKGVSLGRQGKPDDEIACYDDVVARFGASDEAALREWVAVALFNKACSFALLKNIAATIAALSAWREFVGAFDCANVRADPDFDGIRLDPAFEAFLQEMGCHQD